MNNRGSLVEISWEMDVKYKQFVNNENNRREYTKLKYDLIQIEFILTLCSQ